MEQSSKNRRRIIIAAGMTLVFSVSLVAGYADIMVFRPDAERPVGSRGIGVERGPILDRNGRVLALQTELYTVSAWVPYVRDPDTTAVELAGIMDRPVDEILDLLTGPRNFVYLQRRVPQRISDQITSAQAEGRLRGILLEPTASRTYPHGDLAAHVLGFVGTENRGLDGIEFMRDRDLFPTDGRPRADMLYGNQVVLTIDINIQQTADRLVRETLARERADSAMMVVLDARSGEVLAYSSAPTFNPNTYASFPADARRNRPVSMIFEPGSVFKVFSLASALELGSTRDGDVFVTDGIYHPESWGSHRPITDIQNYGTMDLRRVMVRSSNVGVAYATENLTAQDLYSRLVAFGFGEPTNVGINGEEAGLMNPPERWTRRSLPTIAIGQEVGVTAMQIAAAATTFSNGGVLVAPQIVREIIAPDGTVLQEFERRPVREVISPSVAETILDYLHSAAQPGGTGVRAQIEGVEIAAKTGTAEYFDALTGTYSSDRFIGSTLALFPRENPEIIVYMVVENPQAEFIWGARVAAPVVAEMAEFLIPYLGIQRDGDRSVPLPEHFARELPSLPEMRSVMPDLTRLPRRVVSSLHSRDDISVEIEGSGWVVRQTPAPGTPLEHGMTVRLELE